MKKKMDRKSGQVVVEYALLLVSVVAVAMLAMELVRVDHRINVSPTDDQSGEVVKFWKSLSSRIACDDKIDEGCSP